MDINPDRSMPTSENENISQDTTRNGSAFANENTSQDTTQNGSSLANESSDKEKDGMGADKPPRPSPPKNKDNDNDLEDGSLTWPERRRAYGATLFAMGSVVHIVASIVTVMLFFIWSFPPHLFIWSFPPYLQPLWLVPVYGSIITYIAFLIIAWFCYPYIGIVRGISTRNISQLRARLGQIHARLDALGILGEDCVVSTDTGF